MNKSPDISHDLEFSAMNRFNAVRRGFGADEASLARRVTGAKGLQQPIDIDGHTYVYAETFRMPTMLRDQDEITEAAEFTIFDTYVQYGLGMWQPAWDSQGKPMEDNTHAFWLIDTADADLLAQLTDELFASALPNAAALDQIPQRVADALQTEAYRGLIAS